jgi:predicted nucleic acid-binding protein
MDSKALYIVSGDNDLLDIHEYKGIQIITAKEFCDTYLN